MKFIKENLLKRLHLDIWHKHHYQIFLFINCARNWTCKTEVLELILRIVTAKTSKEENSYLWQMTSMLTTKQQLPAILMETKQ